MDVVTSEPLSMISAFVVTITFVRDFGFLGRWGRTVEGAPSLTAGRSSIICHFLLPFLQQPLKTVRLPAWLLVLRLPLVGHATLVENLAGFSLSTDILKFDLKHHINMQN